MSLNKKHLKSYLKILFVMNNRVDMGFAKKSNTSKRWMKQFFSLAIMGIFSCVIVATVPSHQLGYSVFFSMLMMMLMTSFLSEYSNILLDSKDNSVLFHQPISSKTIFAGRLAYILIAALASGLALSAPTLIYVLIRDGLVIGSVLFLSCLLVTFFSVFSALFLYLLLMKVIGGEKFKDLVSYLQIGMALIFLGGYYFSIELLDVKDLANFSFSYEWWGLFVPPMWQVAFIDFFKGVEMDVLKVSMIALALVSPFVLGVFSYKYLSLGLKTDLVKFDNKDVKKQTKSRKYSLSNVYIRLFAVNKQERGLMTVYKKLFSRDRVYKMTVYPAIAYSLFMPLFKVVKAYNEEGGLNAESSPSVYITALYFLSLLFISALLYLSMGDFKNVSDLYRVAPLKKQGIVLSSVLKVLSYNFFLIPLAIGAAFIMYFWGWGHMLSVLTVFFAVSLTCILRLLSGSFKLPLSISKAEMGNSGMAVMMVGTMALLAMLGVLHYFIMLVPYGLIVYTSILAIGYFVSMRVLRVKSLK